MIPSSNYVAASCAFSDSTEGTWVRLFLFHRPKHSASMLSWSMRSSRFFLQSLHSQRALLMCWWWSRSLVAFGSLGICFTANYMQRELALVVVFLGRALLSFPEEPSELAERV